MSLLTLINPGAAGEENVNYMDGSVVFEESSFYLSAGASGAVLHLDLVLKSNPNYGKLVTILPENIDGDIVRDWFLEGSISLELYLSSHLVSSEDSVVRLVFDYCDFFKTIPCIVLSGFIGGYAAFSDNISLSLEGYLTRPYNISLDFDLDLIGKLSTKQEAYLDSSFDFSCSVSLINGSVLRSHLVLPINVGGVFKVYTPEMTTALSFTSDIIATGRIVRHSFSNASMSFDLGLYIDGFIKYYIEPLDTTKYLDMELYGVAI